MTETNYVSEGPGDSYLLEAFYNAIFGEPDACKGLRRMLLIEAKKVEKQKQGQSNEEKSERTSTTTQVPGKKDIRGSKKSAKRKTK